MVTTTHTDGNITTETIQVAAGQAKASVTLHQADAGEREPAKMTFSLEGTAKEKAPDLTKMGFGTGPVSGNGHSDSVVQTLDAKSTAAALKKMGLPKDFGGPAGVEITVHHSEKYNRTDIVIESRDHSGKTQFAPEHLDKIAPALTAQKGVLPEHVRQSVMKSNPGMVASIVDVSATHGGTHININPVEQGNLGIKVGHDAQTNMDTIKLRAGTPEQMQEQLQRVTEHLKTHGISATNNAEALHTAAAYTPVPDLVHKAGYPTISVPAGSGEKALAALSKPADYKIGNTAHHSAPIVPPEIAHAVSPHIVDVRATVQTEHRLMNRVQAPAQHAAPAAAEHTAPSAAAAHRTGGAKHGQAGHITGGMMSAMSTAANVTEAALALQRGDHSAARQYAGAAAVDAGVAFGTEAVQNKTVVNAALRATEKAAEAAAVRAAEHALIARGAVLGIRAVGGSIPLIGAVVGIGFGLFEIGSEISEMAHGRSNWQKVASATASAVVGVAGGLVGFGAGQVAQEGVHAATKAAFGEANAARHSAAVELAHTLHEVGTKLANGNKPDTKTAGAHLDDAGRAQLDNPEKRKVYMASLQEGLAKATPENKAHFQTMITESNQYCAMNAAKAASAQLASAGVHATVSHVATANTAAMVPAKQAQQTSAAARG